MTMDGEAPCPQRALLAISLSGGLSDQEAVALFRHLAQCASCLAEFALLVEDGRSEPRDWSSRQPLDGTDHRQLDVNRLDAIEQRIEEELRLPERELTTRGEFSRVGFLGEGGLGEVHRYRDEHLGRDVAVKFLHAGGVQDPEILARFERECEITGVLNHPAIVPVHGRGECCDGRPFYVMAFVDGKSLAARIRDAHAGRTLRLQRGEERFRELLAAFVTACGAVEHAHRQGIRHRDLKPDNIMVRDDGVTMVVDWGLGKSAPNSAATVSRSGTLPPDLTCQEAMGTPAYMAPEQIVAGDAEATELADVHCLGAVLYEILTNSPPRRLDSAGSREEQLRQLRERVALEGESWDVGRLKPVPRELASICRRAMARRPDQRYASAAALAADVQRWLVGEEVQAHRYSTGERAGRRIRRHAGVLATISAALLILVALAGVSLALVRQSRNAEREARRESESALQREEIRRLQVSGQLSKYALDSRDLINVRGETHSPHASWPEHYFRLVSSQTPQLLAAYGDGYRGMICMDVSPDMHQVLCGDACGRLALWDVESGKRLRVLEPGEFDAKWRRGRHYLSLLDPASVDPASVQKEPERKDRPPCFASLCWLANSREVAAASLNGQGVMIHVDSGERRVLLERDDPLTVVARDAPADRLLFGSQSGALYLVERNGQAVVEVAANDDPVTDLLALESLGWVVGRESGKLELRSAEKLELRSEVALPGPIWCVDGNFAHNDSYVAVAAGEGLVRVLEVQGPSGPLRLLYRLRAPLSQQRTVQYHALCHSPDGDILYAVDSAGVMVSWEIHQQRLLWTREAVATSHNQRAIVRKVVEAGRPVPLGFRRRAAAMRNVRDGRYLLVAGEDLAVKAWKLPARSDDARLDDARLDDARLDDARLDDARLDDGRHLAGDAVGPSPSIAFDGQRPGVLWVRDALGTLSVVDAESGHTLARRENAHRCTAANLVVPNLAATNLALHGSLALTGGEDGLVRFWRFQHGSIVPDSEHSPLVNQHALLRIAIDAGGRWVAATDVENRLVIWRLRDGSQLSATELPTAELTEARIPTGSPMRSRSGKLAFSPDGRYLAAFGRGQSTYVCRFDQQTGIQTRLNPQPEVSGRGGTALVWNPAHPGHLIGADDHPRIIQSWDGAPPSSWTARFFAGETVTAMATTPDEKRIVFLERDGSIRFIDCRYGLEMTRLQSSLTDACDVAFGSGQRWLAIAAEDGRIEFWDSVAGKPSRTDRRKRTDDSSNWKSKQLGRIHGGHLITDSRCVMIDQQDRVMLLAVHKRHPADGEGQLVFSREGEPGIFCEPVAWGDGYDNRVPQSGVALALGPRDQPVAVVRRRVGGKDPYQGMVCLVKRHGVRNWTFEKIVEDVNEGFYPVLNVDQEGHVTDVLHFSFESFYLKRSRPGSGGQWTTELLGLQGDGLALKGRRDRDGRLHLLFDLNRENNTPTVLTHAVWSAEKSELVRQPIWGAQSRGSECFGLLPGGEPVTAVRVYDWEQETSRFQLMKGTDQGWQVHQLIPDHFAHLGHIDIAPDGSTCILGYHREQSALTLRLGRGDQWRELLIVQGVTSSPQAAYLRFDTRDRPTVVLFYSFGDVTSVEILRRNEPLAM